MYTRSIGGIGREHRLLYHLFADDAQFHLSLEIREIRMDFEAVNTFIIIVVVVIVIINIIIMIIIVTPALYATPGRWPSQLTPCTSILSHSHPLIATNFLDVVSPPPFGSSSCSLFYFPSLGVHSDVLLAHLVLLILATCPAHCPLMHRTLSIISFTPDFLSHSESCLCL